MTGRYKNTLERARHAAIQSLTEARRDATPNVECQSDHPEHFRIRTQLMVSLRRFIETCGMMQHEAADFFGIPQPEISHLVNLKVEKFSADRLINLHARAGITINLNAKVNHSSS
jgi:predicted XRE-type DNA-binding protein